MVELIVASNGRDMRIIYFNADGKQVRIDIARDHQLTGNRLCCGSSVAKSNLGWIKLMWAQGAQVKMQENSILSVVQMRDNGCVVNDAVLAHGGKQEILTPGGVKLPLIIIADNFPMYRGWNVARYLRDLVVSIWHCETKHQNQNLAKN